MNHLNTLFTFRTRLILIHKEINTLSTKSGVVSNPRHLRVHPAEIIQSLVIDGQSLGNHPRSLLVQAHVALRHLASYAEPGNTRVYSLIQYIIAIVC